MSGSVEILTLNGTAEYTGLAGAGLFTFSRYNNVARTSRVVLLSVSYTELVDDPITTNIRVFAVPPGGGPTERMLLGAGLWEHGMLDRQNGNAYLRLCGIVIPREPGNGGAHWNVEVLSDGKDNIGTLIIDHDTCPSPDTDPSDSLR